MIFTRHAYERYRQFHMLDRPQATDEDARIVLDASASAAVKLPARTHRGDEVWTIHALGVELVVKRDGEFEEPVCVTVLPPARFRGLTPLQAESVEAAAQEAKARADEAQREVAAAKAALEEHKKAAQLVERSVGPSRSAAVREALKAKQATLHAGITTATKRYQSAVSERDVLCSVLKTMRQQIAREDDANKYKAALRIAVRHLRVLGAADALAEIAAVEPGLASEAFAGPGVVRSVSDPPPITAEDLTRVQRESAELHAAFEGRTRGMERVTDRGRRR